MKTAELLALHKITKAAIMNDGLPQDAQFPCTVSYPAPRGRSIEITWTSFEEFWTARRAIINDKPASAPKKPRTAAQRQYIADLRRNGWI